jgi:GNAT superfamily N-acetyltransferase
MIDHQELFLVPGCVTGLLQVSNKAEFQALLERSADYCLLVDGHPPQPDGWLEVLEDRPPGRPMADKLVLGFSTAEHGLIGVLDAIRNYPSKDAWLIGLLLIDPAQRSRGLGRQIYRAFEAWAMHQGARHMFLGVVEKNDKALKFWRTMGFEVVERQSARHFGKLTHAVITMRRYLVLDESD